MPRRMRPGHVAAVMFGVLAALVASADAPPAAAQSFCEDPLASCGGIVAQSCLARVGAGAIPAPGSGGDAAANDTCQNQLTAYRNCLARIAELCPETVGGTTRPPGGAATAPAPDRAARPAVDRVFCQGELDVCLSDVDSDYGFCRDMAGRGPCRDECQDERRRARERCDDSHRSCLTTGNFQSVFFEPPMCASDQQQNWPQDAYSPPPDQDVFAPQPVMGSICRNGLYYCFLFQPGPVGGGCWCQGNPAIGLPPFNGMVSLE